MHGNAATFCEPYGPRELVSEVPPLLGLGLQASWCALKVWYLAEMLLSKVIGP